MTTETMIPDLVSAGGVVYKICGDSLQVAVCSRKQPLSHNLPKGTPEVGETLENTACREVEEETGLRVEILDYIGFIEYDSTHGKSSGEELKRVHYFLNLTKYSFRRIPNFNRIRLTRLSCGLITEKYVKV